MNAYELVNKVLETDLDDPKKFIKRYADWLPKKTVERWCFTEAELNFPQTCNSYDVFIAHVSCTDFGLPHDVGYESYNIQVERNGRVKDMFEDGTRGVPEHLKELASEEDSLQSYDGEEVADKWFDVYANERGNFLGWTEDMEDPGTKHYNPETE